MITKCNVIIVGNNGLGKTSIFSGLEYIYAGFIDEAEIRKFGGEKKTNFYNYLKREGSPEAPFFEVKTIKPTTFIILTQKIIIKMKEVNGLSTFPIWQKVPIQEQLLLVNTM